MIILRQKKYSDDEKSGMSTGAKVALGVGATAAAFAGARRGMFGNNMALRTNQMWGNMGSAFGSERMINSAAKQMGNVTYRQSIDNGMKKRAAKTAMNNKVKELNSNWLSGGRVELNTTTNLIPAEVATK